MANIVYNLEKFAYEEIIQPYLIYLDNRCVIVEHSENYTREDKKAMMEEIYSEYKEKIYSENGLDFVVSLLKENKKWANQVFSRLKYIDFTFYQWLDKKNPLIKLINKKLNEKYKNF